MQDRFAHRGDRAGVMHVRAEIRAVVDTAQNPLRVGDDFEQSEADAIGRGSVDCITFVAARLDPHAVMPGHAMAHARLRTGRGDDDMFSQVAARGDKRLETFGFDAIIVCHQESHPS
jgi:hypothetical protein